MAPLRVLVMKDLRRLRRAPLGMLLILAFPLIFAGMLALSFGGGGQVAPKVRLLVEDRDDTFLSGLLVSALGSEQVAQFAEASEVGPEGLERIENDEASALLRIPPGFADALLLGDPVTLELVLNPAQGILPEVAEQMFTVLADVLDGGSRLLRGPLEELEPYVVDELEPGEADVARVSTAFFRFFESSGSLLMPPAITLETVQLEGDEPSDGTNRGSVFMLILPGISVWALFALGDLAMRDIMRESVAGTLRRQLTAPLRARDLVLGKALYTAAVSTASLVILSAMGWIVAGGGIDLAGFALLSMAVVVAVTGYASVVYGLARTERQGATLSSILLLLCAFLGGSFVPLPSLPAGVRSVSPFSPFYWGTDGFIDLIRHGASLTDVLPNVGVLAGLGVVLLLLGTRFLEAKSRSGAIA